jgi:hypothetical protein
MRRDNSNVPNPRNRAWLPSCALALAIASLLTVGSNWRARAFTTRFAAPAPFGDDANAPCDGPDTPCAHIQTAVNNSGSGDLIELFPGTYFENVTVNQSVTIQGDAFNPSIVNGGGIGPVFIIQDKDLSSAPLSATLSMMTITNGNAGDTAFNAGGGINNSGTLTVVQSTINGNKATSAQFLALGGGISNGGTLTVINSTISGNQATGVEGTGGGIYNAQGGTATLLNTTINGNSAPVGGGTFNSTGTPATTTTLNFTNTIISGNTGGDCLNSLGGTISTNSHNLVQDGSCSPAVTGDPKLGPLQNNGGPTFTHALMTTSPAIDAGDDSVLGDPFNLTTDQRGAGFPRKSCAHVDIGAYEFSSGTAPTINCPANITKFTDPGQTTGTVSFTVTVSNDPCTGAPLTPSCTINNVPVTSPHAFPVGMTTVFCSVTDSNGNMASCFFTVTIVPLNICLQDDHTGDTFRFNSMTGQYLYTRCKDGFTLSGTGMVTIVNGYVTITDNKPDRRINAGWSSATLTGRANVILIRPGVTQTITVYDTNPHPTCVCPT